MTSLQEQKEAWQALLWNQPRTVGAVPSTLQPDRLSSCKHPGTLVLAEAASYRVHHHSRQPHPILSIQKENK